MPLQNRRADYVSTFLEKLVSWGMVESRLKKAVVREIERDGHINRKQLRKQHLARAKSRIRFRGRPQQGNGDASEQASSQARRRPRSQNQQAPGGVTMEPASEVQQAVHVAELSREDGDLQHRQLEQPIKSSGWQLIALRLL